MKEKVLVGFVGVALVLSLGACKKKEELQKPAGHPPGPESRVMMPAGEVQTQVPDAVKAKWGAVKLGIEDKASQKTTEATIKLGAEYSIAGSSLKVKVGEFIPDFRMEGLNITSVSNEPNNPAVRVFVYDGGKEIFKGWLYAKFPAIHPFQHEKYGLVLKEGVKKG